MGMKAMESSESGLIVLLVLTCCRDDQDKEFQTALQPTVSLELASIQ